MLPLLLLAVGTVALWPLRGWLTAEAIARWSPAQSAKAAVCLWALYGVKSLSVAVPLSALTAAGGLLFPYPAALFVNLFGTALAQTLPYLLGRRNREELTALQERYAALRALERALDCRSVFLLRLSGAPPGDVVSFYLGAAGVSPRVYAAGIWGSAPRVAVSTLLGSALFRIGSPRFWLSLGLGAGMTALSVALWKRPPQTP